MGFTAFDDMDEEKTILVYKNGCCIFDGPIYDLTENQKKQWDTSDYFLLNEYTEGHYALFVLW